MSQHLLTFSTARLFQYWDLGIIIAAAAILMTAFTVWLMYRLRVKAAYAALVWVPFLVIVLTGYAHTVREEKASLELWIDNIKTAAKVFALTSESLGHAQLTDLKDDNQQKIYQRLLALQTQWREEIPFAASIYTLKRIPGTPDRCFFAVSCPSGVNKDGEIDESNEAGNAFGTPCNEWSDALQRGFDGAMVVAEKVAAGSRHNKKDSDKKDSDKKDGGLVTVIVPLHDLRVSDRFGHPYTEAVLGIDVFKDSWSGIAGRLHVVLVQTLITYLVLYAAIVATVSFVIVGLQKLWRANAGMLAAQLHTEQLTKAKSNFMAAMSKEISTALESVVSFTDILTQRVEQNCGSEMRDEAQGLFEIIHKNSQDLMQVVNDVIDYARSEANTLEIELTPMSLKQVFDDVSRIVKPGITAKTLDFSVHFADDVPTFVLCDPVRLRQILTNIVNNAVKLIDRGSIQIHCSAKPPTTDFYSVIEQKTLFAPEEKPFVKLDSKHPFAALTMLQIDIITAGASPQQIEQTIAEEAKTLDDGGEQHGDSTLLRLGGEGLGLSFAKRLAALMDGIVLVSAANRSLRFSLLLNVFIPNNRPSAKAFQPHPLQGSQIEPGLDIRDPARIEGKDAEWETEEGKPLKHTRVLIVEDVAAIQMILSTQLREAGAIVDICENGDVAIRKINENIDNGIFYDIILMDTQMPVMDGFQAAAALRQQEFHTPIIAMTAYAHLGDKGKCVEAGCDDYLSKPVDGGEMIAKIKKMANR
ncbi:MAG: response regulator [Planctomycetaceae bacterium]|nr:response regulator [Planctomycetaceae bacterium]